MGDRRLLERDRVSRYARAWCLYLVVLVVLLFAMQAAGVPWWARNVFAFACGWNMAKPLRRIREDESTRR